MPKRSKNPSDYIVPIEINGLCGRMIRLQAPKNKKAEILYIYGHHSSLERYFGVAEYLNRFGAVTVPDLPGFGGMDPFYKIGEKPSLDNMADYLAAFIKLRYKNRQVNVAGFSLGFMVVTRMLQKYPKLAKQINILISQTGFTHRGDFVFKRRTYYLFLVGSYIFSFRLPAAFLKYFVLRGFMIRLGYKFLEPLFIKNKDSKMRDTSKVEYKKRVEFEVHLWQCNDVRTYMSIGNAMLSLDLTGKNVNQTVNHVAMDTDRYFNNIKVEQHMRQIYSGFNLIKTKAQEHAPSVIATAQEAEPYMPQGVVRLLSKKD